MFVTVQSPPMGPRKLCVPRQRANTGESNVNKNQIKGAAKDIAGKVQEEAGRLVGSEKQQAKGLAKQVSGKVQRVVGDATELVKDATKTGA